MQIECLIIYIIIYKVHILNITALHIQQLNTLYIQQIFTRTIAGALHNVIMG